MLKIAPPQTHTDPLVLFPLPVPLAQTIHPVPLTFKPMSVYAMRRLIVEEIQEFNAVSAPS